MKRTLVVFARAPERGRVKTRLAAAIGEDAALALYDAFLSDSLAAAGEAARRADAGLVLAAAGPVDHPRLIELATAHRAHLLAQPEGDLGTRMGAFIDRHLPGAVCIVGSDAPTLSGAQIARGFTALVEHEVVLGPGLDGGYWLLGVRRAIPELLADMPWSTDRLLGATLGALAGRSASLLEFYYDVDDAEDLALLRRHLAILPPEIAPATRRAIS